MKRFLYLGVATGFVMLFTGLAVSQEKKKAPSYVKDEANAVWTILSKKPVEKGMALVYETGEGKNTPVTKGGKEGWMCGENPASQDGARYMYFNILNPAFKKSKSPKVDIIIEYFDEGEAEIMLRYDSSDQEFKLVDGYPMGTWKDAEEKIVLEDTGKWKTATFHIEDARFENNCNGADFRLEIPGGFEFTVGSAAVVRVK